MAGRPQGTKNAWEWCGVVEVPEFTGDVHNLVLDRCSLAKVSADGLHGLTGVVAKVDNWRMRILNVGTNEITVKNENAGSVAANRFKNMGGADLDLESNRMLLMLYDGTISRWRVALI